MAGARQPLDIRRCNVFSGARPVESTQVCALVAVRTRQPINVAGHPEALVNITMFWLASMDQ